ncbi:hypothetical protein SAMN02949497_1017 [Methylomagnum ishizawai]|uniref:Uncharacterized protein n=1 Tax=Methylomagnum ishizawai TaxID=1760988 RepID=A0A1Y6CSZ9_9GAMM|nr:hypothetical protein [Methylomagnum ishizawai]SMF93728.1 hypothetical protein SAMN02949497_1017 [Methylomagnum ishizawai]
MCKNKNPLLGKGHKDFSAFKAREGETTASANPTQLGAIPRKNPLRGGESKKWVKKTLSSRQEVLIECITGEIYRYLIGPLQPKIRTGDGNNILSEFVPYRSVRDILDRAKHQAKAMAFKEAFIQGQRGFMLVLFSSIMLEENDLSDQNYGLAIPADENGEVRESEVETYLEFIKIDHGQSLNSMRIAAAKKLSFAPVKYFPAPSDADLDERGIDKRTKDNRKSIYTTKRKYVLVPEFIDRALTHFLSGYIDKDCIKELNYLPSTLPIFDGRLLSFYDGIHDKYDICEDGKYWAIAKLIFTDDTVYSGIAERASDPGENPALQQRIRDKIIENKRALKEAVAPDPDFFAFCHQNQAAIRLEIQRSLERIVHNRSGEISARYEGLSALGGVSPDFEAAIDIGKNLAALHADSGFREEADDFFVDIINDIQTRDWSVRGGGYEIQFMKERRKIRKKVPDHVADMHISCERYLQTPNYRALRTLLDISCIVHAARRGSSLFRSRETEKFYGDIMERLGSLEGKLSESRNRPTLRHLVNKYEREDERFFNFFKESR